MIQKMMLTVILLMSLISFSQDTLGKKANLENKKTIAAQIRITIYNEQNLPAEGVTVELLRAADSGLVKTAITDKNGLAELETKIEGMFIAKASLVNHITDYSQAFEVKSGGDIKLPPITLSVASGTLQNVTVQSKKPFIQKLTDRIVVNVESSILSAGSTALDILERSPGITVDQNDAVSLRGRAGVIIMIDGKPTPMSGADLANYLRGLPSNAIERIDIITNPSSKYDAAGTSGIIDIRMKKDQRFGINGTATAGYGQGVYPKANAGVTFNYRNKNVNIFGQYNYNYRYSFNHLLIHWDFFENGITTGGFDQDFYSRSPSNVHAPRIGVDYSLGKNTIIGAVVSGSFYDGIRKNDNKNIILDANMQPEYMTKTLTYADAVNRNNLFNVNFKHTFDSTGKELSADGDYGIFNTGNISDFTTQYLNMAGSKISPNYFLSSNQSTDLTIKSAKADYVHPLNTSSRFEAGVKTSTVSADNDLKFFEERNGSLVTDARRTNRFKYKETNNAAYLNYKKEFKKINFQVGLRAEQTNLEGNQVIGNKKFDSSYLQFFPSSFFNYNIKEDQTIGVSVSRRIYRPGYSMLNPFVYFADPALYNTGNPALKPEFTWSYELSYTHKNISVTAGYGYTKNIITGLVQQTDTNNRVNFEMPQNLNSLKQYDLIVSAPFKPAKWWNMQNNFNVYYAKFDGNVMNTVIDNGIVTFTANIINNFTFKKGWSAELSGRFLSPRQSSLMYLKTQWAVGAGAQKTVMKGKGTIRFNISDIFWTALPDAITNWSSSRETWHSYRESRVGTLNFTYRFGNNKVQAARRRTTASEEERRRAEG